MISQFFVLSPRGDTIIFQDYRGDVIRQSAETFFRKVKFWEKGDAPPVFNVDGINYLFIKRSGLYFACTTRFNVSPSMIIELLNRVAKVFKDYCGVLTEDSIRKNFVLIYELLNEMIDFGCPQGTSTEMLKTYIYNEAVMVEGNRFLDNKFKVPTINSKTTPSTAVHKPIATSTKGKDKQKNEIFVDILERLNVLFNANGYVLNSTIDGCIQMKSYLSGNPELRLALNEDLIVGKGSGGNYGAVVLDDCNFHESVKLDEFESLRTLSFVPPDGEFAVMNYRITGEFRTPFRIFPFVEEMNQHQLEVIVKIRADIPEGNYGANVIVKFPVPKTAATIKPDIGLNSPGQTAEYRSQEGKVVWNIKKFVGGTEHTLRTKITLKEPSKGNIRRELGPISMSFEIPMFNVSSLSVRYLRIAEKNAAYKPYRWVRYVTQSNSYVCRV